MLRRLFRLVLAVVLGLYALALLGLLYLKYLPPLTTTVQVQRRVEALASGADYHPRYRYVPLARISDHLEHAVVAAEDARFYRHRGLDWVELKKARGEGRGRMRGASTITQQLVKNLFLTTHRSYLRKGAELALTPAAELILGKERILELYLNVIEWGPGVFGAEAAARHYYDVSAAKLGRERAARLAAVIPAPLTRRPGRMGWYSSIIQTRMRQMGW